MHTARSRVGLLTCVAAQATQPAGVVMLAFVSGIGCVFARQICQRGRAKDLKGMRMCMLALSLAYAGCIWVRMCCTWCIRLNVCDCVPC